MTGALSKALFLAATLCLGSCWTAHADTTAKALEGTWIGSCMSSTTGGKCIPKNSMITTPYVVTYGQVYSSATKKDTLDYTSSSGAATLIYKGLKYNAPVLHTASHFEVVGPVGTGLCLHDSPMGLVGVEDNAYTVTLTTGIRPNGTTYDIYTEEGVINLKNYSLQCPAQGNAIFCDMAKGKASYRCSAVRA